MNLTFIFDSKYIYNFHFSFKEITVKINPNVYNIYQYKIGGFEINKEDIKEIIRLDFMKSNMDGIHSFYYHCIFSEGNYVKLYSHVHNIEEFLLFTQDIFQDIELELIKKYIYSYVTPFI